MPPRAVTEIERCRNERNSSPIEIDLTTDDSSPKIINEADLRVGVTVAEGFVKAAGLLILSTKGLMGIVTADADVPALLGRGRGLEEASSVGFEDCT